MPRYWENWTYKDVVEFLEHHGFRHLKTEASHYHYLGTIDGKQRLVQVPFHGAKPIKPKTLSHGVAWQSGIPNEYWLKWAAAGNKKVRKTIHYPGAKVLT